MTFARTSLVALASALAVMALGCGELSNPLAPEPPDPSADAETAIPDWDPVNLRTVGHFQGHANPEAGTFIIEMVDGPSIEMQMETWAGESDFHTVSQPLYCSTSIASDGDFDTNPGGTMQIASAQPPHWPAETTGTGRAFCEGANRRLDGSHGGAGWDAGVFCTTVLVSNFTGSPLNDVYVVIDSHTGSPGQYALGAAFGAGAESTVPPGHDAPSATFGMWYIPYLATSGPGRTFANQWVFGLSDTGAFDFSGRILATAQEDCGNGLDDDCDGNVNNHCTAYADLAACDNNDDCASGLCNGGFCASTCLATEYGLSCTTCPGGGGCNNNGFCDNGAGGDGQCTCKPGFHGSACEYSCSDGEMNGLESDIDVGDDCPNVPEVCNGRDDDGDGNIDEDSVCRYTCTQQGTGLDRHCYFGINFGRTWQDQRDFCRSFPGYDVAMIGDDSENTAVTAFAVSRGLGDVYLGLSDPGSGYEWVDTQSVGYDNWSAGEPIANRCAYLDSTSGIWETAACTATYGVICESITPGGSGADDDGDGILNAVDHCPDDPGNDNDRDGICDNDDNSKLFNPMQIDSDGDLTGEVSDLCPATVNDCSPVSDAVCPCNCDVSNDADCTNLCGDLSTTGNEVCDGDCPGTPGACDDGDPCTDDYLIADEGDAKDRRDRCSARCVNIPRGTMACVVPSCDDLLTDYPDTPSGAYYVETGLLGSAVWGGLETSRLYSSSWRLNDGGTLDVVRAQLAAGGATIGAMTATIDAAYLDTIDVLFLAGLKRDDPDGPDFSAAELAALSTWVEDGGWLVLAVDKDTTHYGVDGILANFGFSRTSDTVGGPLNPVGSHDLVAGGPTFTSRTGGDLNGPVESTILYEAGGGEVGARVLEGAEDDGGGVIVFHDEGWLSKFYLTGSNVDVFDNIVEYTSPHAAARTFCDMDYDGGGWTLVAYAQGGGTDADRESLDTQDQPRSRLRTTFSAEWRADHFYMNADAISQGASDVAMTWTFSGDDPEFPNGGIGSYTEGIEFNIPSPGSPGFALDDGDTDRDCSDPAFGTVTVSCTEPGPCGFTETADAFYTRVDSMAVGGELAYGVFRPVVGTDCDQPLNATDGEGVYFGVNTDFANKGVRRAGELRGGVKHMAIWIR